MPLSLDCFPTFLTRGEMLVGIVPICSLLFLLAPGFFTLALRNLVLVLVLCCAIALHKEFFLLLKFQKVSNKIQMSSPDIWYAVG